jgi:hypothetical protein
VKVCDEPGCKRKHHARGKCGKHYQRAGKEQGWFLDNIPAEIAEAAEAEARRRFPLAMVYLTLSADMRRTA